MNDGVLHTVLVKNISKLRFARLFPDYSAGNHEKLPKDVVRFSTAKVVRIHSDDGDIVTCLDGECSHSHDVTLRLADKKLNFFALPAAEPERDGALREFYQTVNFCKSTGFFIKSPCNIACLAL